MGADGCKWMRMGAIGHMVADGTQNDAKRSTNSFVRQCVAMHDHCKINRKLAEMVEGVREDTGGECLHIEGFA